MKVPMDQWNQFGGNPAGSGFRAVKRKVPAAVSWRVELPKPTGTGSPVLGPDGTIYIGTFDGTLVAVRPDGQVKWTTAVLRGRAARDPGMMRRSATGAGCSIMMPR